MDAACGRGDEAPTNPNKSLTKGIHLMLVHDHPEDFDLVILGGGVGAKLPAFASEDRENRCVFGRESSSSSFQLKAHL